MTLEARLAELRLAAHEHARIPQEWQLALLDVVDAARLRRQARRLLSEDIENSTKEHDDDLRNMLCDDYIETVDAEDAALARLAARLESGE